MDVIEREGLGSHGSTLPAAALIAAVRPASIFSMDEQYRQDLLV
ncbi:hypothetical protein ACFYOK_30900 [Microbispora bryophytorum]